MLESPFVKQDVLSPASQSTEEEKDEESQFSEGQLFSTSCQSDDSELSEEIMEGKYIYFTQKMGIFSDAGLNFHSQGLSFCFLSYPLQMLLSRLPKRIRGNRLSLTVMTASFRLRPQEGRSVFNLL